MDPILQQIDEIVKNNPIVIFMKGTPQFPMCGYSSRAAEAIKACGVEFAYVNVLSDMEIFNNLPRYQDWPTFPQIYVNGELIGGSDITVELFQSGELKPMLEAAEKRTPDRRRDDPTQESRPMGGFLHGCGPTGRQSAVMNATAGRMRSLQALTMPQYSSAVISASYKAPCACLPSQSSPASPQALASTVWP